MQEDSDRQLCLKQWYFHQTARPEIFHERKQTVRKVYGKPLLSQLVSDFPDITELDINPLMISDTTGEAIAVDGRIAFKVEH